MWAVTELLKDQGCGIADLDAETSARDGEIWFRLECMVELGAGVEASALEEQLRWLTQSHEMRADLTFDGLRTDRFQPLSGA